MSFESVQYLTLGTFRKTGVRVDTPVWFAEHAGSFYVLSNNQAGKIKRLRNNSRCQIATCTFSGRPTGPWHDTEAFLVSNAAEAQQAHRSLQRKYGWQMRLLDGGAWLGGRIKQRTYISIRKPDSAQ